MLCRSVIPYCLLCVLLAWSTAVGGTPIYVDADAGGADDGTSWTDAFTSLQDAIANAGDALPATIWVAEGTYYPDDGVNVVPGDRAASFQLSGGLEIYGGFDGTETALSERDPVAHPTVLSGDIGVQPDPDDNSYHVVRGDFVDPTARLDGFVITAGRANGGAGDDVGGGMTVIEGAPTVVGCRFLANEALTAGGAAYCNDGTLGTTRFINCSFVKNTAINGMGPASGGGLYATQADVLLANCVFIGNVASGGGDMTSGFGGAIYHDDGQMGLINSTLYANSANLFAGGIFLGQATANLDVDGTILWDNSDTGGVIESAQIEPFVGTLTIDYSIVHALSGGLGGAGNLASDPLFSDPDGPDDILGTDDDDLAPLAGSPAIDAGNTPALPLDEADIDGDADTGEVLPLDASGAARRVDDPDTGDTGGGSAPIVDIGAYEFQVPSMVLYVDADALGAGDGSTWCDAFASLQDGLAAATAGMTLRVAQGSYQPDQGGGQTPADRAATFQLVDEVVVEGGYAGCGEVDPDARDVAGFPTVLTGDLAGDDTGGPSDPSRDENSFHVVSGTNLIFGVTLDGLTIVGGNADGMSPDNSGGGLALDDSVVRLERCVVQGNRADGAGGGMLAIGGELEVLNSTFALNEADQGGGFTCQFGTSRFVESTFYGNTAISDAGTQLTGMVDSDFSHCRFVGNTAGGSGGGLRMFTQNGSVTNTIFSGNEAADGFGGGLDIVFSDDVEVTSCSFSANIAGNQGGGLAISSTPIASVINNIFWANEAPFSDHVSFISASPTSEFNLTGESALPGTGNIGGDPLFVDADGPDDIPGTPDDDLRPGPGSPAIDAGNSPALPLDAFDIDDDGDVAEPVPLDLAGAPRLLDDPFKLDTGIPGSPVVDMGAFEFQGDSCPDLVIYDDFDDGALDPSWTVTFTDASGWTATELASRFEVTEVLGVPFRVEGRGVLSQAVAPLGDFRLRANVQWTSDDAVEAMQRVGVTLYGGGTPVAWMIYVDGWLASRGGFSSRAGLDTEPLLFDTAPFAGAAEILIERSGSDISVYRNGVLVVAGTSATAVDLIEVNVDHFNTTGSLFGSAAVGFLSLVGDLADCNGNGLPDDCDINAGTSADCDMNDIPDDCDIAACDPGVDPSCGDCNLNGAPDGCDITEGISSDDNMDGVPDECTQFVGVCPPGTDMDWSCFDNWILDGDIYPDNGDFPAAAPYHVVLDNSDDVLLDVDAEIATLLLREDAVLRVSLDTGPGPGDLGNLTVTEPGGITNQATLLIGQDHVIDVSGGTFTVDEGGTFAADGAAGGANTSTVVAGGVVVNEGACGAAGSVELSDGMMVNAGVIVLSGPDEPIDPGCCPPDFGVLGSAEVTTGDMIIDGPAGVAYASAVPLELAGDFVNHSPAPEIFDWLGSGIRLVGTNQVFEVGGRDLGDTPLGFFQNFALGSLEVLGDVTFVDAFDNDGLGQGACTEALYVQTLTLLPESQVTLDGVRLYVAQFIDLGGTIIVEDCSAVEPVAPVDDVADCGDVDGNGIRDDNCMWWAVVDGVCVGTPIPFADMGGPFGACPVDGTADGNDRFHALNCFANTDPNGGAYPCEADAPVAINVDAGGPFGDCAPDGVCDGNDAFAALNAFGGTSSCSCAAGGPAPVVSTGPDKGARAELLLVPSATRLRPGDGLEVEVWLDGPLDDLRGYQLHMRATGGARGQLTLVDVAVTRATVLSTARPRRPVHPDGRAPATWSALNTVTGQVLVGQDGPGSAVEAGYLATFVFRAAKDASGTFVIDLLHDPHDAGQRTFLFATRPTERIALTALPVRISVVGGGADD